VAALRGILRAGDGEVDRAVSVAGRATTGEA
jgi:hypothetical protein